MEKIPFMDLGAQIKSLEGPLRESMEQILTSHAFIGGPIVQRFNEQFLRVHVGASSGTHGVGCANGTSAITVALRALGIGPGDEVLLPNNTFFGTAEPVVEVGATPVLVEVDSEYMQMDLNLAVRKVTAKTKAILPVHLYGMVEPMDQILDFAKVHKLKVIEDCAQAHCAKWSGKAVGTFGDVGTFSFYPGKNLGAFGDAGYILSENAELFAFMKRYIDHGRTDKYVHEFFGSNTRIDAMQAAVLTVKLTKLEEWSARRRELAKAFDERLSSKGFKVLKPRAEATPVYHLYVVEVSNRQEVMAHLKSVGIDSGVHYPIPLSMQPAFAPLGYKKGQYPVSETKAERIMSLPFFPEMTMAQVDRVVVEFLKVAKV